MLVPLVRGIRVFLQKLDILYVHMVSSSERACVILSVRTYEWSQHLLHSENTSLLNSAVKNMFKLWGGRDISPHVTYYVDKLKRLLHRTNASFAQKATRSTNIAQPASRAGPNTWTSS